MQERYHSEHRRRSAATMRDIETMGQVEARGRKQRFLLLGCHECTDGAKTGKVVFQLTRSQSKRTN